MIRADSVQELFDYSIAAASRRDYANKMNIALKEARETHYWLRLVQDAGTFGDHRMSAIIQESLEIKMILTATVKTSRRNLGESGALEMVTVAL